MCVLYNSLTKQNRYYCIFLFLVVLTGCGRREAVSDSAALVAARADSLFQQAAARQQAQDYEGAIGLYGQLLEMTPPPDSAATAVGTVVKEALMQRMYCHFFSGRRGSAAAYYTALYADTSSWVVRRYPRCVEICLGYSLYEAAQLTEAVEMIGRALARSEEGMTAGELYADYGIAGAVYNQTGNIPAAIRCTEKCAALLRTLDDKTDLVNALGNLIYQYQQVGDFDRSLAAYEELIALPEVKANAYHRCVAEVNIISLFEEWGLEEEVDRHLGTARQAAAQCGIPEARLRVKNLEASLLLLRGETEAAMRAVDTLAQLLPTDETESFYRTYHRDFSLATELLNAPAGQTDMMARARQRVRELQMEPLDRIRCDACYFIGRALAVRGQTGDAIAALETCVPYIRTNGLLNYQRRVYHALAQLHHGRADYATAVRYYALYDTANVAFTGRRSAGLMSQFRVKYSTREKEQANELLRTEVHLQQRTIQYYTVTGLAAALLAAVLLVWGMMRHRALHLRHAMDARQHELDVLRQEEAARVIREQEKKLRQMLNERVELNRRNEEMLALIGSGTTEGELHRLVESFAVRLITPQEEQRFRRQFVVVYPTFLMNLRRTYPAVSPSEELLIMLIRMNLTNEEIALTLGIRRGSVNTARSRLRKKLGLPTHESLEDFIRQF